jgi:hypothetical protein
MMKLRMRMYFFIARSIALQHSFAVHKA